MIALFGFVEQRISSRTSSMLQHLAARLRIPALSARSNSNRTAVGFAHAATRHSSVGFARRFVESKLKADAGRGPVRLEAPSCPPLRSGIGGTGGPGGASDCRCRCRSQRSCGPRALLLRPPAAPYNSPPEGQGDAVLMQWMHQ
eukprot:1189564-Prorocentrum_minimum.AAC.1